MNVYRSSPPLPSIFCPSHLLPSAYNPFVPDSENSSEFESFSSDNEAANAEAAESARDEARANSPSRSEGTCTDHSASTHSAARKQSRSSQTADNKYVASRL